ncbi:GGL domain-domain-containing protein [Lobosporangium transversale]|uniref:Guanine nucleotide-binding protein subunit gamma n=1 Tax=Lobosporangium transversale TaxID=64571 RepID=A0A1Y2H2L7_9FUNG|nr:GGL domain-domain-containing protein [Lobosporangium transversale]ORZ28819.1 GGL domain-domain-containing protein [Lobosporangium transversale]|eukprot:XP_021886492.1 GGL domain-domain-containing protein [Lobosporangium transversale]
MVGLGYGNEGLYRKLTIPGTTTALGGSGSNPNYTGTDAIVGAGGGGSVSVGGGSGSVVGAGYGGYENYENYGNYRTASAAGAAAAAAAAAVGAGTSIGGVPGVSELKLKRFLEHNQRLREQLEMHRVPVSEASRSLIQYATNTQDPLLPIIWGVVGPDPFAKQSSKCCTII